MSSETDNWQVIDALHRHDKRTLARYGELRLAAKSGKTVRVALLALDGRWRTDATTLKP